MNRRTLLLIACVALFGAQAQAQNDRVRTTEGTVSGKITDMNPFGLVVTKGSTEKKVPLDTLQSVQFGGEPSELTQARIQVKNGNYAKAIEKLDAIQPSDLDNPYVKQEVSYYRAISQAKLALVGSGSLSQAGKELNTFVRQNRKSFHFLEAAEVLGDMLVVAGNYDEAAKRYAMLDKAPYPSYKMRSSVLLGETLQAQDKHADAIAKFESVLASGDSSSAAAAQMLQAKLGKATSLAATNRLDEGVALVQSVIKDADPEEAALNAAAYNALGTCYQQAGKTREALFAFLHVDLLYSTVPEAHAESLYHLSKLWEEVGQPPRAREARETLKSQYSASNWAKK